MLTGKDIGNLISQPEMISTEQLPHISELSEKYPYSQLFSILYIKGMHSSDSLDFETALKKHSFRISDRARLYALIHEKTQLTEYSSDSGELQSDSVSLHDQSELENANPEALAEELELNTEEPLETEVEAQDDDSEVEIVTSESEEEAVDGYTEESDLLPIDPPEDPLEENILHHAVAQHYQLDALSPEEEAALERKKKEAASDSRKDDVTTAKDSHTSTSIDIQGGENNSDTSDSHVSTSHDIEGESKLSFTGWLRSNEHYEEREDEQSSIKALVEEFSEFDPMASLYGEVEKPKKEFFSPTKKAKESLQEDRLPVSETLAKIYVMQGNYPKAIEAYNELILAFPEKKIFFANQIEDLKKKLNT